VPLVIVKCGRQGVVAVDAGSGATHLSPALEVRAVDPTGAGDVFVAGFMYAALHDLPLAEQLAFANLCAGVSVTRRGGAMGAPSLGGIDAALAAMGAEERARYAFVKQLLAKNAEPGRNPSSDQSLHSEVHVV
jgi:sugar/nucleoside kinase (ribokinase family)